MRAGLLKSRIAFQRKGEGSWETILQRWARIVYLRGAESVLAARLVGRNTVVITVRVDRETKTVTTA